MADNRRPYTQEFKEEAIRLLNTSGKSGPLLEQELGVGERHDLPLAGTATDRRGESVSRVTASRARRSWLASARSWPRFARDETSCEKQWPSSQSPLDEVPVHRGASGDPPRGEDGQTPGRLTPWLVMIKVEGVIPGPSAMRLKKQQVTPIRPVSLPGFEGAPGSSDLA